MDVVFGVVNCLLLHGRRAPVFAFVPSVSSAAQPARFVWAFACFALRVCLQFIQLSLAAQGTSVPYLYSYQNLAISFACN